MRPVNLQAPGHPSRTGVRSCWALRARLGRPLRRSVQPAAECSDALVSSARVRAHGSSAVPALSPMLGSLGFAGLAELGSLLRAALGPSPPWQGAGLSGHQLHGSSRGEAPALHSVSVCPSGPAVTNILCFFPGWVPAAAPLTP